MNYIVFDLEATCWKEADKGQSEIIEIGAVKISDERRIVSEFERFVKPRKHPILSEFCKNLTSITQEHINNAAYFDIAAEEFKTWIGYGREEYILCSWGFYDKKQFESDCKIFELETDWVKPHVNLKQQHAAIRKLQRAIGMKNALQVEGVSLEGTHHRGIDDARNIAKIFLKYFDKWSVEVK
jgi:inhibitor of KinA sporulation pathway (predicted exonuclease)